MLSYYEGTIFALSAIISEWWDLPDSISTLQASYSEDPNPSSAPIDYEYYLAQFLYFLSSKPF